MGDQITIDLPVSDRPPREPRQSKAKTAPKDSTPKRPTPPTVTGERKQAPWEKQMEAKLSEMLGAVALVTSLKCHQCATVVVTQANDVAKSWTRLAAEQPKVRKVLEALTAGSAYGAVATSTIAMLMPIAIHHGLVPASIFEAGSATPFPPEDREPGLGNNGPTVDTSGPVNPEHYDVQSSAKENGNGGNPPDNANPLV